MPITQEELDRCDAYFDADLTSEEADAFRAWLCADPEHIREFTRRAQLHRALRNELLGSRARTAKPSVTGTSSIATNHRWTWHRWCAAAILVLVILGVLFFKTTTDPNLVVYTARIDTCSGRIFMTDQNFADRIPVAAQQYLSEKNGLEFDGPGSAVLKYGDGTVLNFKTLAPGTPGAGSGALRLNRRDEQKINLAKSGKRITVTAGVLTIDAASQPESSPLIICTPMAEVTVIGTVFRLDVTTSSTRLDVSRGKVRITRFSDSAKVDVSSGEHVIVNTSSPLLVQHGTIEVFDIKN